MIKSRSIPDVCCSMVQRYEKYFFMYHICTIFRLIMHQAPTEVFICAQKSESKGKSLAAKENFLLSQGFFLLYIHHFFSFRTQIAQI